MFPLALLNASSPPSPPVDPNIVALYHFNGDYNDSSSNGHDLAVNGAVSIDSSVYKFAPSSMRLNMSSIGANAQASNVFDFGNQRPFTISYWVSQTVVESNTPVFKTAASGNTCIELRGVNVVIRNSDFSSISSSLALTAQVLSQNNIVVVGDGTNIKAYVNGVLMGTALHPSWPSAMYPLFFGSLFKSNISNLTVDEFVLYDSVLYTSDFTPQTVPFNP